MVDDPSPAILFFDGNCNLCDGFVRFVLDRDARGRFRFASLQSDYARRFFEAHAWTTEGLDSVVLFKEDQFYVMSNAALEVLGDLSGIWPRLRVFRFLPRSLRDGLYRWVAANRYRFFGRRDQCRMPKPSEASRFLS